jgi:hypothetical protein
MAFSASPAVTVREIDLTGGAPNVTSSTGATVGNFLWGPVEDRTLVSNEDGLVSVFGAPNEDNAVDFLSAAYFLKYTNSLFVTRQVNTAQNAHSATTKLTLPDSEGADALIVKNDTHWNDTVKSSVGEGLSKTNSGTWIAKYPGALGNALTVSWCPAGDSDGVDHFSDWAYADQFEAAPGTSAYASERNASNDEVHVAVIDRTGEVSGSIGSVLETFPFLSVAKGAMTPDNSPNYISDVLNTRSQYIWNGYFGDDSAFGSLELDVAANWGNVPSVDSATNFGVGVELLDGLRTQNLGGGKNSVDLDTGDIMSGFDLYEDTETVTVDLLIAPQVSAQVDATTVVNDMVSIATARKDCVVITSPHRSGIVGQSQQDATDNAVTFAKSLTSSSYAIVDNNYLKVYDKYNDNYVNIPAASSTAGLMAATDLIAAPWFSPAGQRRGNYLGVTDIVANPNKTQRDTLYKANVNPIANIPGSGVILFGDKTMLRRPSAFDRINVRRLFLVLERAIAGAAKNIMFEFNDEFTRAEFVNIVEPLLREVKGRRGITDFRVVCDETNNTGEVIDRNEFVASIFIKPARSINYVTLNFVAVRTGVDFEEVVGGV